MIPTPDSIVSLTLPIRANDVLCDDGIRALAVAHEIRHGNGDLVAALKAVGIAGPFQSVTPWEQIDEHGVRRINAGGYAALPFGDRYPPLIDFVQAFLERDRSLGLPQQSASAWRAALATNLVALLARDAPSHADSQVFFSNSGAEAVECAVKFVKAARPKANYLINFTGAYHGKTYSALSLTPNEEYQAMFRPLMPGVVTLPYGDADKFAKTIKRLRPDRIGGVILEPIQGESGVITPPDGFLKAVNDLCRAHGILIVADEIQSGLGRTGHWFASIDGGLEPDIVTLAKPLGGGLIPIGATIARRGIYKKMLSGLASKRHSNTFGGGSLAMAIGLKSLEILADDDLIERAASMGTAGLERLRRIQGTYPDLISAVRGAGMLFALQFHPVVNLPVKGAPAELIGELSGILGLYGLHHAGVQANLSLSSKRVVRLTPALTMPDDVFARMWDGVEKFGADHPSSWKLLTRTPLEVLIGLTKIALA